MFNMLLTAVFVSLFVFIAMLAVFFCAFLIARRYLLNLFAVNFIPQDKDTPTPFALVVQAIANQFGSEIASHLKSTFMGLQSVDAKNDRREAAAGIISGNSVLGAILSSFPAVGKKLGKNPAMAALADMAINRVIGAQGPGPGPGPTPNNRSTPVQFKF